MRENVAGLIAATCRVFGERTALVQGSVRRTFAELDVNAGQIAAFLQSRGLGPHDRIAIAMPNCCEYVEIVLAAMRIGAVPVNLNYRYTEPELRYVIDDCRAVAVFYDVAIEPEIAPLRQSHPDLLQIAIAVVGTPVPGPALSYGDVMSHPQRARPPVAMEAEWLLYTGGTTGMPKGVASTHGHLYDVLSGNAFGALGVATPTTTQEFEVLLDELSHRRHHVTALVAPPFMHGTGLYTMLATLLTGGTVIMLSIGSYRAEELAGLVDGCSVTHLTIVGDVFARPLLTELDRSSRSGQPYDLSSLERVRSVGTAWSAEMKRRLLKHCDAELQDVLASSEAGAFAMNMIRRDSVQVTDTMTLLPGVRVLDSDESDVPQDGEHVGRLAAPIHPDVHYMNDVRANALTFRVIDGVRYCIPGDLAVANGDGTVRLLGRDSRVVNTGGEKVFVEEVEAALMEHPAVHDAVVVGVPSQTWGQEVVAVLASAGGELTIEQIRRFLKDRLAGYKAPRRLVVVPEISRRPNGKLDLGWAGELARSAPGPDNSSTGSRPSRAATRA